MDKFLNSRIGETLWAIFGWFAFSLIAYIVVVLIFEIIGISFFDDLSNEIKIIVSLILGYSFWFSFWDKRVRN